MKLNGRRIIHEDVEVQDSDIIDATIQLLCRANDISTDDYLRNGVIKHDDPNHRHGSIAEVERRVASESDLKAFATLDALKVLKIAIRKQ